MRKHIRLLLALVLTGLFSAIGYFFPAVLTDALIKSLAGTYAVLSALMFYFMKEFNAMTGVGILSQRELQRYTIKRAEIRSNFWKALFIGMASAVALWVLGDFSPNLRYYIWFGPLIGLLFSIITCYSLAIVSWIDQFLNFCDALRLREQGLRQHEAMMKRLAESKK